MADRKRDPRFAALASDPRYRLPGKKESRTAVDPRFGRLFTDQEFRKKASVDRYGRKIKPEAGKKELEKLYRLDTDDSKPKSTGDKKAGKAEREVVGSDDDSEEEGSEDAEEERVERRDPAREGGFSDSESEEESSSEEESDEEADLAEDTAGQEQTEDIPLGEVTKRIAAVNMDWDNIRASDILAVAQSFLPGSGRVEKVTVFPSEFGRERLEREELEGPPREIFASSAKAQDDIEDEESGARSSDDEEDEDEKIRKQLLSNQADEGGEFDTAKLRQYQLERLRYYYAVIETDSKPAAKALYDSMDGREYLTTANFFDLRFIPDDVSFEEDTPKEECSKLPEGYKPNDFKTEALTHSKVRLTWDDDDTTRKEVQKRAFSRAEIDENDLQAYIGSDSSGDEDSAPRKETGTEKKASKREAERAKMRAALGLGEEPKKASAKSAKEPVGEMEITFTSGLGGDKGGKSVFENGPQDEESTRERYIRKEKERKQKRKEKMKASRTGEAADTSGSDSEAAPEGDEGTTNGQEDDGFNDPFFDDPSFNAAAEKKAKKAERLKKRAEKAASEEEAAARRKELELLMADDQADAVRHFDMREIEQQEKEAKRKGKKGRKGGNKGAAGAGEEQAGAGAEEFKVDTEDPRFKGLFESHEYAIDPTNPRYKATQGMKALLEEGRKKRKRTGEEEEDLEPSKPKQKGSKATKNENSDELKGLVARLKGKGKR